MKVGSMNGANRLSTKEIAKACNISEFVIYDHFQSKDNLVSQTDRYVSKKIVDEIFLLAKKKPDFQTFWNDMNDYLIAHNDMTSFLVNYGHIFPRANKPSDQNEYVEDIIVPAVEKLRKMFDLNAYSIDDACFVFLSAMRSIVNYAQLVSCGMALGGEEGKKLACQCASEGLMSFMAPNKK